VASLHTPNGTLYVPFSDAVRTPNQKRHALGTRHRRTAAVPAGRAADAYRLGTWDP
jgi:hypothetical protein